MAYEPLHHKYRPQTFSQLVGQGAIATTLANALQQRRIAPAYLFCGPRGTGKTSSARILAKSLNCISHPGPTPEPCGTCEICRAITNGSALDFVEIDAASNTGVDNIRELIERAQFAPVQCRYKVYVIDECLTGDTLVLTQEGLFRIDDPAIEGKQALSYNETSGHWEFKEVVRWLNQGERQILEIQTTHRKIRCTENHLIRTNQGWAAAKDVSEGVRILSPALVAAERSSTNLERTDEFDASLEDISLRATPTVKSPTALSMSLSKQTPYGPSVDANAERNWTSLNSFSKKEKGLTAFNHIGKNTPTRKITGFGTSEQKASFPKQRPCLLKSLGLFTEPFWGTARSLTPIGTAGSPDWLGHTGSNSRHGWNTRPLVSLPYNPNLKSHQTEDTEQPQSAAVLPVILTSQRSLPVLSLMDNAKLCPSSGCPKSPQKDWLGGTWMTAPSVSRHKAAPKFNFTQKDILSKKISSSLSGLMTWATPSRSAPTEGAVAASDTTTSLWGQTSYDAGYRTCASTPSPQWTTNLETVVSVRPAGVEQVYDIEVEDNHNFVANGLLVHNCHMLSVAAFNALLKTLEEPPERVVFVLATTDPQRVLPTIISRCQRFDYRRIPLEDMVSHLTLIAGKESIHVDDEAVRLVAQVSQGGLRDAESLLDQLSLLEPPVTAEKVWDLVGAVPERDLLDLVRAIATDDGVTLLDQARKLMDRGREPLIVLQNLAGFYRDLLIAKTAGSRQDLVAITPPTWAEMCEFAQTLDVGPILAGQQHLRSAEVQVKNTTQPRLWLEVTLMGLLPSTLTSQTSFQPTARVAQSPAPLPSPVSAQNGRVSSAPVPTPVQPSEPVPASAPVESVPSPPASQAAQPPALPDPPPVSPAVNSVPTETVSPASPDLTQLWQQLVAVLQPMGTRALMQQQGRLLSFSGQTARIGINSQPLFKMAQGRVANIEEAFYQVLQQKVKVSLEVAIDSSANTAADSGTPPTPEPNGTSPSPPSVERTAPPSVREEAPPTPAFIKPVEESLSPPLAAVPEKKPILQPQSFADMPIESDFERAVKSFAQFFNGQVVSLEDGIAGKTTEPKRADSDDPPAYSDVPF